MKAVDDRSVFEQGLTDTSALRAFFTVERPNVEPAAGHLVNTGVGRWWLDRSPDPRTVAVEVAGNWLLRGDPRAVPPDHLRGLVRGFVDAPRSFEPVLRGIAERFTVWDRVFYVADTPTAETLAAETLTAESPTAESRSASAPDGATVRRLGPDDAIAIASLSEPLAWIARTWGGATGLAASGRAWGAFLGARLASVACTFFLGFTHEELGVVTEPYARRRGLSTACAAGLCADIVTRGHLPSWSTSADNAASQATARRLGFRPTGTGVLYLVDTDVPVDTVTDQGSAPVDGS